MILIIQEFIKGIFCTLSVIAFASLVLGIWRWIKFRKEKNFYNDNEIGKRHEDEIYKSYINNSFKI